MHGAITGEEGITTKYGVFYPSQLKLIGWGAEYRVYVIDNEMVLKVSTGYHFQNHGIILEELAGRPFIPKVYDYCEHGKWYIMQRIQGSDLFFRPWIPWFEIQFDYEKFCEDVQEFSKVFNEYDFVIHDLGRDNVMIDQDGDFWIVDVGGFTQRGEYDCKNEISELIEHGRWVLEIKGVLWGGGGKTLTL
ncbi:hypothetical protein CSV77_03600 [Sporosarcina sp. P16b]|uniref:hypothetical protein n=1 Tax=Sporosarcina sp. P16b TaxID=2048261 RepID=UPI000C170A16|nr:hypothetical protein [Sporosarcina sp. P16b]PIC71136.1 hypothetical protein CSV77_03600 [Sporosarcina sp. P16b]